MSRPSFLPLDLTNKRFTDYSGKRGVAFLCGHFSRPTYEVLDRYFRINSAREREPMPLVRTPCADWIGTIALDNYAKRNVLGLATL